MTADPYQFWSAQQIAAASGCPPESVPLNWPGIVAALDALGISDRPTQVAAIGTIAIETASTFAPVREAFWLDEEWRRANLRYYPFYGRGYIQLTWEDGYTSAGAALGLDMESNPDLALDPIVAAQVLAWYFNTHGGGPLIPEAARRGDWTEVRRLVQGGADGLDRLIAIATALGDTVIDTVLQYNPDQPPERQVQDYACSIRTLTWMLKSIGVNIDAGTLQDEMVPDFVTPAVGLLDGRGNGLATVMRRHVPDSVTVNVVWAPSWDDLLAVAGDGPVGIGSGALYHWLAVADIINATTVKTANPAPNYPPGAPLGDTLTRDQFNQYAPWAMVTGTLSSAPVSPPAPSHQPDTFSVGPGLAAKIAALGDTPASDERFLDLWSEATGASGLRYLYFKLTGEIAVYPPAP